MCGRFTLTAQNADRVAEMLGIEVDQLFEEHYVPRWNIAPMQPHWIAVEDHEQRLFREATWGLVNFWDPDRRTGAKQINARAESLDSRRPFRGAFQTARCLVPANGFFEWTGEKKARRPIWYHRPAAGPGYATEVFAFAGLYARARLSGEDEATTTFTIVTTEANALVGQIHDRMPVVLPDEAAAAAWLDPSASSSALRALLRPAPSDFLTARPVSQRVNSVNNDDPACLDEAEAETQASLL